MSITLQKHNPRYGRPKAHWWNQASMKQDDVQDDVLSTRTLFKITRPRACWWNQIQKTGRCPIETQTKFKNNNSVMLLSINASSQTQWIGIISLNGPDVICKYEPSDDGISHMPHIQNIETAVNKVNSTCAHANYTRTNGAGTLAQLYGAPEWHNICQITPASLSSVFTPLAIYPFAVLNGFTALSLRRGESDDVAVMWQSVHLPWHR